MKKLYVLVAILFLSGCSTKFVYRNIDWLASWYLSDYIKFTDAQEDVFDANLEKWLAWHKENELPKYVDQLKQVADDIVNQEISIERIEMHRENAQAHWFRLREHVTPDIVEMAPLLSSEQVTYLFAALEKQNDERQQELDKQAQEPIEERAEQRLKSSLEEVKKWLGKPTAEQESLIENTLPEFHANAALWLEYKRLYQNELRALFASTDRGDDFKARLTELMLNPEQFRSQELQQRNADNSDVYVNMLLSLSVLSTEKQRQHAKKEIMEFSDDFMDLMK